MGGDGIRREVDVKVEGRPSGWRAIAVVDARARNARVGRLGCWSVRMSRGENKRRKTSNARFDPTQPA